MAAHQGDPASAKVNRWLGDLNKWTQVTKIGIYGPGRKVFGRKSNEVAPMMVIHMTLQEWEEYINRERERERERRIMREADSNDGYEVIPGINNAVALVLARREDPNPHVRRGLGRVLKETSIDIVLRLPFLNIGIGNVFDCAKLARIPKEDILEADIARGRTVWPGIGVHGNYTRNYNEEFERCQNAEPGVENVENNRKTARREALEGLRNGIRGYLSDVYSDANPNKVLIATGEHHGRSAELRIYEWNDNGDLRYHDLITDVSMSHMVSADDPCKIILWINKQGNKKDTKPAEYVFTNSEHGEYRGRTSQLIVCNSGNNNGLDDIIRVQLTTTAEHGALTNGDTGFVTKPCWFSALFSDTGLPNTWARTRLLFNEWLFCSRPAIYQLLTTSVREMRNVSISVQKMDPPVRVTVNDVDDICYGIGRLTLQKDTQPGSRNQAVSVLRYNSRNPNNMKKYLWRI